MEAVFLVDDYAKHNQIIRLGRTIESLTRKAEWWNSWEVAGRPEDWHDVPAPASAKARAEKRSRQRAKAAAKQASDGAPSRNEGDGAPSRVGDPAQDGPPSQGVGERTQRPLLAQPKWQPRPAKYKKPDKERGEVADAPLSE